MKTWIIGDVHGCAKALAGMIGKLMPDPSADRLILLGDLFDRGPDSWEVWQQAQQLEKTFGERFVFLLGNHEDYLLRESMTLGEKLLWKRVGRDATVRSFKEHGAKMEDARPWIQEHHCLFFRGEGFQCVHAGLKVVPLEDNDRQTLLHDHAIVLQNLYGGPLTVTGHIGLPNPTWFAGDGKTVTKLAYDRWQPLPETGVICIDTGCGKGGPLTAMEISEGQFRLIGISGAS